MIENRDKYLSLIATLNKIGVALSAEKDHARLLELILSGAMELTHADGGTLYLVENETELSFAIITNKTLKIKLVRKNQNEVLVKPIPLYIDGEPNLKNVASYCYHENKAINIEDVYNTKGFDFSGTRNADKTLGYNSKSFLTIPLRDHENKLVGVLQLINAIDDETGNIIYFSQELALIAESLASQAAITLTKQSLIAAQKKLFEAFLELIAKAIDEKSPYTSNHCKRVPELTMMIATAMNNKDDGPLKDHHFTKDQLEELNIAAWLHDCGKIVTPTYVMDKATKLQTIYDRIEVINHRFEIIKRDLKIEYYENKSLAKPESWNELEKLYKHKLELLQQSHEFILKSNIGSEFISELDRMRIRKIGTENRYLEGNTLKPLLSEDEITNLSIARGTLNDKEREIIQNHVKITHSLLHSLPYPEHLKNVPEIAGSHHERMDGKGYPKGIDKNTLSVQARILAIADIFEALTSADRPYKTAKHLKEVLKIMEEMRDAGHIDPDIYDLFVGDKIYLEYAALYLDPKQIQE